jgi:bifunctional DNase/RNase
LFYYADQPASQIAGTPGAAKASLHKARRPLREYITAHRPDLIPATSRRTAMTAVRIAHAEPWPGRTPDSPHVLVVLTDDAGHRAALPVRLPARSGAFWRLLARQEDRDDAGEMTGQLLREAGITVTAVTVTDLGPAVTATRIDIAAPEGTRQVTTRLADGLALAVITGAPLAVDDPVMDRLAEPVTGPGPLRPVRSRQQPPPGPRENTRFEPRNMAFTDGLHRWQLGGTFLRQATGSHDQDYSCTTEDGLAVLAAAVPEPAGFAFLSQEINADDYRSRAVAFRGDLRTTDVAERAGLVLRVVGEGRPGQRPAGQDPRDDPENHFAFVTGTGDWARHEVTAQVPPDASRIIFGVFRGRPGQAASGGAGDPSADRGHQYREHRFPASARTPGLPAHAPAAGYRRGVLHTELPVAGSDSRRSCVERESVRLAGSGLCPVDAVAGATVHALRPSWRTLAALSSTPNAPTSFPPRTRKI